MFGRGGKKDRGDTWARQLIAVVVVGMSFACILAISGLAIGFADDRSEVSKTVFTAVLPVLGTWVGTVLAFYFARENLEAATSSTLRLTGRETSSPVTAVMIKEVDFIALDVPAGTDPGSVTIADVRKKMREIDPPSRRLPIRDPNRVVLYVIHDSTLTAFADKQRLPMAEVETMTIGDLLADDEYKRLIEAIGFISEKAEISEARYVMASIDNCNDIFVTPTGKRDERAIGWLTNTSLAEIQ
jgi:hypothetical protein